MNITEWWKKFVGDMNTKGIPVPTIRDPKTGFGSISLTLVFLSFNLVLIGLIGKYSKMLDGVDVGQATTLFGVCAALYFGRKISRDSKGLTTVEDSSEDKAK
jgi:hypothetical protein